VAAAEMLAMLRERHGVEAQGGQAHMADRLIRVGHMGWVHEPEMREAIAAIADVTEQLSAGATGNGLYGHAKVESVTA
jgi:aspartate aminotransferase-like enzyme